VSASNPTADKKSSSRKGTSSGRHANSFARCTSVATETGFSRNDQHRAGDEHRGQASSARSACVKTEGTTVLDGDAGQLDRWAAIHHDLDAGVEGALRGGLMYDAEL
jgi:hypothetical protein